MVSRKYSREATMLADTLAEALSTLPGMGFILIAVIALEVEEPGHLVSYAGMIPGFTQAGARLVTAEREPVPEVPAVSAAHPPLRAEASVGALFRAASSG